jgi:hypothetical protein
MLPDQIKNVLKDVSEPGIEFKVDKDRKKRCISF